MNRFNLLLAALLMGVSSLASARTIEVSVNGLVCAFCAQGIEKILKAFPATEAVFVSLENRIVAVKLKDGSDIGDDALRKAIKDAGYTVVSIRRTEHSLEQIRKQVKHEH